MKVLVLCYGGGWAYDGATYLVNNGWTNVYAAPNGYLDPEGSWGNVAWIEAGLPTSSGMAKGTTVLPCDSNQCFVSFHKNCKQCMFRLFQTELSS